MKAFLYDLAAAVRREWNALAVEHRWAMVAFVGGFLLGAIISR